MWYLETAKITLKIVCFSISPQSNWLKPSWEATFCYQSDHCFGLIHGHSPSAIPCVLGRGALSQWHDQHWTSAFPHKLPSRVSVFPLLLQIAVLWVQSRPGTVLQPGHQILAQWLYQPGDNPIVSNINPSLWCLSSVHWTSFKLLILYLPLALVSFTLGSVFFVITELMSLRMGLVTIKKT